MKKILFTIIFLSLIFSIRLQAQTEIVLIYSDTYHSLKNGVYDSKSQDKRYISSTTNQIDPFILSDTSMLANPKLMYLAIDDSIVLFNNMNPMTMGDVAGTLKKSTLVEVDTIFYNNIYINSPDAPMSWDEFSELINNDSTYYKYKPTYDVWYAIKINGKKLYRL